MSSSEVASSDAETNAPATGFQQLGLGADILAALDASGYTTPTPIQAQTIPLLLQGRDVLGQAQTGTGKTAAFALPLLQRVDLSNQHPQVLVLAPTRELAIQVADSFETYAKNLKGLKVTPIYGGQDYHTQFRQLSRGSHVVVGTPGRVMDHMRRGSLNLDHLQCLVLDEADEMLRMGFAEDVDWVLTQAPKQRQMALFSATMPGPIRQIANTHLNDPAHITIAQATATADTVNQRYVVAPPHQKQAALLRILEAEPTDGVLVFVKMRSTTEPLADYLAQHGMRTAALNGDVAQKQRERIVDRLKAGKIDIIVATDVAARGLDVQRISHVINYDPPHDSEAYVHRIGRTGRAGRSGEAILFLHPREKRMLKKLEYATRQTIAPMPPPSNRVINKQRVANFHERITSALSHSELDSMQSVITQYLRDNEIPLEMVAAALAVLANGEAPLIVKEHIKATTFAPDSKRDSKYGSNKYDSNKKSRPQREHANERPAWSSVEKGMETFRIEVGGQHSVQPGNIVGAIANEAGIGSGSIGKIRIYDHFSTVDLPQGMPHDVLNSLRDVVVLGRKLQMSRDQGPAARGGKFQNSKRSHSKPSSKQKYSKKPSPR